MLIYQGIARNSEKGVEHRCLSTGETILVIATEGCPLLYNQQIRTNFPSYTEIPPNRQKYPEFAGNTQTYLETHRNAPNYHQNTTHFQGIILARSADDAMAAWAYVPVLQRYVAQWPSVALRPRL